MANANVATRRTRQNDAGMRNTGLADSETVSDSETRIDANHRLVTPKGRGGRPAPTHRRDTMNEATIKAKVTEWNAYYQEMGREMRLKDLCPEAYEAEVSYGLLDVCENDVDLALAVFNHSDNRGGWMCGDVPAFLERKRSD